MTKICAAPSRFGRPSAEEGRAPTLASAAFRNCDLFRTSWIDRMVRDHLDGIRPNGRLVWALLCLKTWFLTFVYRVPGRTIDPMLVAWDVEMAV